MNACIICGENTNEQTTCSNVCRKALQRLRSMVRRNDNCDACGATYLGRKCRCVGTKSTSAFDRPFAAWDGEGEDKRYTLLANSYGDAIHRREGLGTIECLEFLLDTSQPSTTNVWYGFGYDVGMILRDMPMHKKRHSLKELWEFGRTRWQGYTICYVPRKSFSVSHARTGRRYSAYDVIGFFQCKFEKAVEEWCDSIPPIITEGKAARESFNTWPMDRIIEYNAEECRLLVTVMSRFREALRSAGLFIRRWDGAGAIAAAWLRRNEADRFYGAIPERMSDSLSRTFFGGRSDILGVGRTDCHYSDISSAYPAAMCEVPDMSGLTWHEDTKPKKVDPYGIYLVEWKIPHGEMWGPLPWRWEAGSISFPLQGVGWYVGIEVAAAIRRFGRYIKVRRAWVPDGSLSFPLAPLIQKDYELRQELKLKKMPANIPIKLGLNSLYGVVRP